MTKDILKGRSIEVPDFFQLSAYDVCRDWGLTDWANALSDRRAVRNYWELACLKGSGLVPEWMVADARNLAEDFVRNPALRTRKTAVDAKRPAWDVAVSGDAVPVQTQLIRDQSVFEYFEGGLEFAVQQDSPYWKWLQCCQALAQAGPEEVNELHGPGTPGAIETVDDVLVKCDMPAWKMRTDAGESLSRLFLAVDLGGSDKELTEQFSAWLKQTRKALAKKRIPDLPDQGAFRRWVRSNYLPYLDLTFLATTRSGKISDKKLADALSPGWYDKFNKSRGSNYAEKIGRSISREAERLLDADFVISMSRAAQN
ncbi:MAG TPA: DUF6387 family protein [Azospira sp.]|nr:DUF6387 family protein [Azospira sp.]